MNAHGTGPASRAPLRVSFESPTGRQSLQFASPFQVGRADHCAVCINNEYVSRIHAEVVFESGTWLIRDLGSSNGLYVNGQRMESIAITSPMKVRLGIQGPELFFESQSQSILAAESPQPHHRSAFGDAKLLGSANARGDSGTVLRRYIDHYFKSADAPLAP